MRFRYLTRGSLATLGGICALGVLLSGCFADKDMDSKPTKAATLQCDRLNGATIEKPEVNELDIPANNITLALFPKVDEICGKFDKRYTLNVSYETKLDQARSTTKLTAKETKTAIVSINLDLTSPNKNHTFKGVAQLEASGKKVLDIGESVQIDDKDKSMLVEQAAQAAINEAKKVLKQDIALEQ